MKNLILDDAIDGGFRPQLTRVQRDSFTPQESIRNVAEAQ
jgi:hypothetical protein